jgi:hypothetical protein
MTGLLCVLLDDRTERAGPGDGGQLPRDAGPHPAQPG